jgi:four helix bundle protein
VTQQADDLKKRTKQFALDVIGFVRTLPYTDEARTIGRQLLRSGPGVASNYRSACRARSRAEFVARIGVALEEADESALWFEILTESAISLTSQAFQLLRESDELSAIFAASSITAKTALARAEDR